LKEGEKGNKIDSGKGGKATISFRSIRVQKRKKLKKNKSKKKNSSMIN